MPHFFRAVAADYDGTLTNGSEPPTSEVLQAAWDFRRTGRWLVLCTGRIMDELRRHFPQVERHFDAIVAENGAVVFTGGADYPLADPVPESLERALVLKGIPVRRGSVILATQAEFDVAVLETVRELGLEVQLVRNRGEMMILPPGVSKGTGLAEALGELGVSHHSTLAVGDAENDHALLEACEFGVAVANAVPSLRSAADVVLQETNGAGILELLRGPLLSGQRRLQPRRWRVALGEAEDGSPATLPGSGVNVLVTGGPGSGKSYLSGLLVEQLVRRQYSVCVFDPEGDHAGLDQLRGVLAVGGTQPLPDPEQLDRLLRHRFGSVVLDLALLSPEEKQGYFRAALPALVRLREETGLPHWIFIEEADQLLGGADLPAGQGFEPTGFCLVTFDPGGLAPEVLARLDAVLALRGGEEWARSLPASAGACIEADRQHALFDLDAEKALLGDAEGCRVFTPARRAVEHVRHWHKYKLGALPPERSFHFRDRGHATGRSAANLADFHRELRVAPSGAVHHHLRAGDFSRWLGDTVGDDDLAARVRGIERWYRSLREPRTEHARCALVGAVERRYGAHPTSENGDPPRSRVDEAWSATGSGQTNPT
jgi:hydroxymethylpyrimidine pyrophosphatase-like HAD family hydrolase